MIQGPHHHRSSTPRSAQESGMSLAEVTVAAALALVGFLVALVLYQAARQTFKKGELASDQQQEVRVAYDRMVRDLRLAGYNWDESGESRPGEEQIEGAWDGAITVRGDYDHENISFARDPETFIAGSTSSATVGNDEIVTYFLKKPDGTGGSNLTFNADVDGSTTATSPTYGTVAVRDGSAEAVTIPNAALTQTGPPYNLYRAVLNNAKSSFGTTDFVQYQLLAENVKSLAFTYYKVDGTTITAPGGGETASDRSNRADIYKIKVTIVGMGAQPDSRYTDPNDATSTSHYRKFTLSSQISPRNTAMVGHADVVSSNPSTPTGLALCLGHCAAAYLSWNANAAGEKVAQYTIKYGTSASTLSNAATTTGTSLYINGLTAGTVYYFAVQATNTGGYKSSFSSQVSGTINDLTNPNHTVPSQVANFSATGHGGTGMLDGRVSMTWDPVTTNTAALTCDPQGSAIRDLAGYKLYRSTSSTFTPSSSTLIADEGSSTGGLNGAVSSYLDYDTVNCRQYYYHMRASDTASCSNFSSLWGSSYDARASTSIAPAAPTGVTAVRLTSSTCTASWTEVTSDTATPAHSAAIDTYKVWRAFLSNGSDPETGTYTYIGSATGGALTYVDSTAPSPNSSKRLWYKISAIDDCPNESALSLSAEAGCNFAGTLSMTPITSGPQLDPAPKTITLTASGGGSETYVSARVVITKSGGTVDNDTTKSTAGPTWSIPWTPNQGAGLYTAVATVTNSQGCSSTTTNVWDVEINSCGTCASIVMNNPDPSTGGNKYYRQQNVIANSCAYPLQITLTRIRARSVCATCANPMKLLKLQYLTTGTFANETSNVVYTAPSGGVNVSPTSTATITFATPLSLPATSGTAKFRFIFSTATPEWNSTSTSKKSVLEADFSFTQVSNLCSPASINNVRLVAPPP